MCLGIPGEVIDRYDDRGTAMGRVAFGSITKEACLALVDAEIGDYVIVHAGVAITVLDEATATATIDLFEQMIEVDEAERTESGESAEIAPSGEITGESSNEILR